MYMFYIVSCGTYKEKQQTTDDNLKKKMPSSVMVFI